MDLSNLAPPEGSRKRKHRVGRGIGSGWGKTSGKGQKGQNSRSGGGVRPGFEGGQMPIYRRLPKRGFTNHFAKRYAIINISTIEALGLVEVDLDILIQSKVLKKRFDGLKILGDGQLTRSVTVRASKFSQSAMDKIQAAKGKAEVV